MIGMLLYPSSGDLDYLIDVGGAQHYRLIGANACMVSGFFQVKPVPTRIIEAKMIQA